MSTAVAETSSHVSSQPARQRSGQGNQSSPSDGFSGLVDSNLNAAGKSDDAGQPDRPRTSQREAGAETQANQRTGIRRKSQDQADTPRASSNSSNATTSACRAPEDDTTETAEALESPVVATVAATATADADADQIETQPADSDTDDAQATTASSAAPTVPTTGIVAAAVTVQIELAADTSTTNVLDASDAITVSNPPATIAAAPAGTAANALARVALDTADTPTTTPETAEAPAQTPADANAGTEVTAATTPQTAQAQATAVTTEAVSQTTTEAEVVVETATAEVQLAAKAQTELTATAKADPDKAADKRQAEQIVASADPKPAPKNDDTKAASQQPAPPKPEARNDRRVEASGRNDDQPNRPADGETRPAQRASHEQTASTSVHSQAAASEQQQPTGFGLSHTTTLQAQAASVQTAQLTALPVAANVPVPVSGLAVEIAANVQIGRSRFDIRLDPPELGRIDVRLDVDQKGQVTSHLIVEKSATLDLLRRDAPQLERALQDAGLKTSDNGLQFSLRDQQQQNGRNDDQGSGRNAQRLVVTDEETIAAETAGRSYGRMMGQRGGIDIRV